MRIPTGDQIADNHFTVAFLGEDAIGQKFAVIRQPLPDDGVPTVIILVVQRPFCGLSKRGRKQQERGGKDRESANGVAVEKHDERIVIQGTGMLAPGLPRLPYFVDRL